MCNACSCVTVVRVYIIYCKSLSSIVVANAGAPPAQKLTRRCYCNRLSALGSAFPLLLSDIQY